jgi:hypothetical protein
MKRIALLCLAGSLLCAVPAETEEPPRGADGQPPGDLEPAVETSAPAAPENASSKASDRIELDATQITGNRELPKVLYIVPWKRSDLGDLVGKPVGSLLDEVLAPVDRDVFKRENRYYRALDPDDPEAAGTRPTVEAPSRDES